MTRIRTESLVALCAVTISIATLFVYLYQAHIMQKQQHTSVWPYVEWLYNNANDQFSITVTNKGIGPAIVTHVEMKLDNKVIADNFELYRTLLGTTRFEVVNSTLDDRVISPGETIELFHIYDKHKARAIDSLLIWNSSPHTFSLSICYCSVYGDCWTSDGIAIREGACQPNIGL